VHVSPYSTPYSTSPIGYPSNIGGQWFSWLFDPRINIGAMINTGGKTSYGFTGLT
jgi:hypothetical protein